ncbi:Hpt domain-containing protein [uncultured Bdellovibrio sp.]|uniref:Hpt domain-containing protein n=1 Tax=Bdellovibrio sp. HCB-162 TaxID=3394234 RepID=UPI0025F4D4BB|nr:Hpt domain-containing protein [uncultured Bdellovibrio sp.]
MAIFDVPLESRIKYLKRRQEEIAKIDFENPDWDFVKKVGHQIKGNAVTFLFPELTELGKRLEDASVSQDIKQIKEICGELAQKVSELLRQLEK